VHALGNLQWPIAVRRFAPHNWCSIDGVLFGDRDEHDTLDHLREGVPGQSKADYIAKMCVSSKEARESGYWLRLAVAVNSVSRERVAWELQEADEFSFMIRAAIRTARSSQSGGRDE
jgi:hypothetical protein